MREKREGTALAIFVTFKDKLSLSDVSKQFFWLSAVYFYLIKLMSYK